MLWEFTPLNKHYDFGFGAMADAFEEASQRIETAVQENRFLNWALPVCFLRRHAIELFLKSMLVILERRCGGVSGLAEIKISVEGKLRPLTSIHGVGSLYNHLKERLLLHEKAWRPLCRTDWLDFPPELDAWILEIDSADKKGTFFRYPDPGDPQRDEGKSMFQSSSIETLLTSMGPDFIPGITALIEDDEGAVEKVYTEGRDVLARELEALRGATTLLSAANFGLRTELAHGR